MPKPPPIMNNTTGIKKVKTDKRARLSIDLEAYPDIKKMLADALLATGLTTTDITIEALRERLPDLVLKLERERALSTAEFLKIYPATGGKMPDPLRGNAGRVNQVVPDQIIPALLPPATIANPLSKESDAYPKKPKSKMANDKVM